MPFLFTALIALLIFTSIIFCVCFWCNFFEEKKSRRNLLDCPNHEHKPSGCASTSGRKCEGVEIIPENILTPPRRPPPPIPHKPDFLGKSEQSPSPQPQLNQMLTQFYNKAAATGIPLTPSTIKSQFGQGHVVSPLPCNSTLV